MAKCVFFQCTSKMAKVVDFDHEMFNLAILS